MIGRRDQAEIIAIESLSRKRRSAVPMDLPQLVEFLCILIDRVVRPDRNKPYDRDNAEFAVSCTSK